MTQYGSPAYPPDKSGKDDNFRGETIFNNTLYVTKGSGGNGIDTVFQVGAAGALPTLLTASSTQVTILPGFPMGLATNISTDPTSRTSPRPTSIRSESGLRTPPRSMSPTKATA